jgi:hypothetical protein
MRVRRNYLWAVVAIVVIAGGIITAILLRKHAPPDAVRLLPNCDAVLYVNFEPVRLLTGLTKTPPKERDPQYEDFVRETGFEFERDLDKAAFAIHYGAGKKDENRYSEILEGRFDHEKVSAYLKKLASATERYQDYDIYAIPVEGRTVRVALLGVDIAAVSNVDSPDIIHGMIDRYRGSALPFSGPDLTSQYYRSVPIGSIVWTIARPPAGGSSSEDHGELLVPGGWSGLLPRSSVVVASARPLNEVHLRADVILDSEAAAQKFAAQVATYLTLFKSLEISMDAGGPDKDVKAAFDSLEVHEDKNEAILTAKVPYAFFKKVMSEPPVQLAPQPQPQTPPQQPTPQPPAPKGKHGKK